MKVERYERIFDRMKSVFEVLESFFHESMSVRVQAYGQLQQQQQQQQQQQPPLNQYYSPSNNVHNSTTPQMRLQPPPNVPIQPRAGTPNKNITPPPPQANPPPPQNTPPLPQANQPPRLVPPAGIPMNIPSNIPIPEKMKDPRPWIFSTDYADQQIIVTELEFDSNDIILCDCKDWAKTSCII